MCLAVGPVAIVSLLTGQLVSSYPQFEPIAVGTQASFCVGIILLTMSFLNLGIFIQLISHSVMRYNIKIYVYI